MSGTYENIALSNWTPIIHRNSPQKGFRETLMHSAYSGGVEVWWRFGRFHQLG